MSYELAVFYGITVFALIRTIHLERLLRKTTNDLLTQIDNEARHLDTRVQWLENDNRLRR